MLDRIILAAAGTGGHIFPALAIYEEIKARNPKSNLLFLGRKKDLKRGWIKEKEVNFVPIPIRGIAGQGWKVGWSLVFLFFGFLKSLLIFLKFKPRFVMGFGSYGSFVPVYLASLLKIPCAIHEQNVYLGIANRILGKRVDLAFLSFDIPEQNSVFKRSLVVGNPIRKSIIEVEPKKEFSKNLLVFGGSQGAKSINKVILKELPRLTSSGIKIWHQTGKDHYVDVKKEYEKLGYKEHIVVPFIDDMASAYKWADLVVSRAGAMTVSELTVVGRPSVLIPFPYSAGGHQLKNARYLEQKGASLVVEEKDLFDVDFGSLVISLMEDKERLKKMAEAARSLRKIDATIKIVDEIEKILFSKSRR